MFSPYSVVGFVNRLIFPRYLTLSFLGAIVGLASAYQGYKASKKAGAAEGQRMALEQEKLDFAKSQYADYKEQYGGLEEDMLASLDAFASRDTLQKFTGEGVADVRSAFGKAREMGERELTRYGLDPNDPRYLQSKRGMGLEESKAEIGARNLAREKEQEAEDKLFAKRLSVGRFGKGMSEQARGVGSAIGGMADVYGEQAEGYGKQAGAGYGLAGKFLKGAFDGSSGGGYGDMMYGGGEEPIWEGSNIVEESDVGDLGW